MHHEHIHHIHINQEAATLYDGRQAEIHTNVVTNPALAIYRISANMTQVCRSQVFSALTFLVWHQKSHIPCENPIYCIRVFQVRKMS